MNKSPIPWNPEYTVNNEVLDGHHKQLFEYLRLLEDEEYRDLTSESFLEEIMDKLEDYTHVHFSAEEEIMKKYGYPQLEDHLKEHKEFIHDIGVLKSEFDKHRPKLSNAMTHYIKNWLIRHILGTDKLYAKYFESRGISTE